MRSLSYDFEGNRVTKQINEGAKVYYLNDTIDELTQVSLELEKTENNEYQVNKYYTRGTELISVGIKKDASSYARKVYLMDGHGSVTALAETETNKQSGKSVNKITDTYTYDAYGNLLRKAGETENDYLYTGEQYNANANPVMYTDPTGYFSLAECSVANAIRSNLDSMRTYINVKKIMSWANMAVTMYDVAQQAQLISPHCNMCNNSSKW